MKIKQVKISPKNYTALKYKKKGIVLHWAVGEIGTVDKTFKNPHRGASAHFCIGSQGQVHQYVNENMAAWHAGNWWYNKYYIGIEHAGGQLVRPNKRKKPTKACHKASAELVARLCMKHNIPCNSKHIIKHKEVKATMCPGSLDTGLIIREANKIIREKRNKNKENRDNVANQIKKLKQEKKMLMDKVNKLSTTVETKKVMEVKRLRELELAKKEAHELEQKYIQLNKKYKSLQDRSDSEVASNLIIKFIKWLRSKI